VITSTPGARVVNYASNWHKHGSLDFENLGAVTLNSDLLFLTRMLCITTLSLAVVDTGV
jgi:hypothetical protein